MLASALIAAFAALQISSVAADEILPLGLSPNNLRYGNLSIGFLPGYGEPKGPNTVEMINDLLPSPMSMVGFYAGLSGTDPELTNLNNRIAEFQKYKADHPDFDYPVMQIALMPTSLAAINQTVCEWVGRKMKAINDLGITVWLRYGHEMNGNWYNYGQQPAAYIKSWQQMTNAVRAAGASDTHMLWAPNSMYSRSGSVHDVVGGYTPYWPGAEYVDLTGLSFYSYGGYGRENWVCPEGFLNKTLSVFDQLYGSGQDKFFILAETASAFTTTLSGPPAIGNATNLDIKLTWLRQLLDPAVQASFPNFLGFQWFEVIKDEDAGKNTVVKEEDFRLLVDEPEVSEQALNLLGGGSIQQAMVRLLDAGLVM